MKPDDLTKRSTPLEMNSEEFRTLGYRLVDSIASHESWSSEMKFPFALGSDPQLVVAKQYGSSNPARPFASRTVFVIGKDGKILYRNLKFPALNETAYTELAAEVAKARM